ncbi:related to MSS51 - mRNA processing protein [Melanopsichium pennsylvanicum]|uniref:Related to MSS51 - mRNA processing protein n=2 Tax=Melanopsichium pennsylvanicum TaxID=63383 RepID=A0AAJ5C4V3_9BASI|nr:related to MSS51-mRNA processing protein [Melanopsichium pennsylvanicum 4]SNX83879.1 related to MSS51 - mRNA processing protein [Melanopsichium pennsylvanicum]
MKATFAHTAGAFRIASSFTHVSSPLLVASNRATPASTQTRPAQHRTLFGFSLFGNKDKKNDRFALPPRVSNKPLLAQDDLFHPFSKSPVPSIRARGERIRSLAPCPVSMSKYKVRRLVNFECPDCGWPTHYSEKEWAEDNEHGKYVARLREANEDEHDLRSGREMAEFKLPGPQGFEETINMSNWDVFFYTRNFNSIESDRSRRHVSKLLTFPTTMGAVIHENSPYTKKSRRLTHEGLRSMIALRQTLHPKAGDKPNLDKMRIFVVGARAESTLPPAVWDQLTYMFPGVPFHLFLIGPEAVIPSDKQIHMHERAGPGSGAISMHKGKVRRSNYGVPSRTVVVSEGLTITTIQSKYEDVHAQLEPFDAYTDVFFAFSPGFGFPSQVAVEEADRQRQEDREYEAHFAKAKSTYRAVGSESAESTQASAQKGADDAVDLAKSQIAEQQSHIDASSSSSAAPRAAYTVDATVSPQGGDIPSEEPAPVLASPDGHTFTALTAAPVVQAQREWARAIGQILSTRCALIATGFSPADVERDVLAFESVDGVRGEFDWLITPGENVFASQQWAVADFDPRVAVKANWGLWAVRGKRYDIQGPTGY